MEDDNCEAVVFRPSKKRKFRHRVTNEEEQIDAPKSREGPGNGLDSEEPLVVPLPASAPLHRGARNKSGVAFSSASHSRRHAPDSEDMTAEDAEPILSNTITLSTSKFVPAAGLAAVKDDQHMTSYIDSKLAETYMRTNPQATDCTTTHSVTPEHNALADASRDGPPQAQTDRLHAYEVEEIDAESPLDQASDRQSSSRSRKREPKPRFDRHGKPLPPRKPRNWRSEDDKARDSLVDRLLSESRMEPIYDHEPSDGNRQGRGLDLDADRRMAEEFEREFRANAAERQAKMRAAASSKTAGSKTAGETSTGPRLGGSKNARMAKK
ncbi:hypothetical protein CAC42_6824 [Sphaceloma murrayae]|uniref:Uncharacterized protein n=1 Tax=Sphaceloma murrayae TaxID=2082308 RepID=A0A2K1QHA1_9PEZI|nr:hypothetical protein CAC42_6824 [Sphaceloma murrayae]